MTTNNPTWTDNAMQSGKPCNVDQVNDNLMYLKNACGLLPVNSLGTKTTNFALDLNKIDLADITTSLAISLPTTGFISGIENKCILDFTTTSTSSPTLPTGVKWASGITPSNFSNSSSIRNILTFITQDSGTTWEGEYKTYGVAPETTFSQPVLSANGTLGGSSFAVIASSDFSVSYLEYMACDSTTSTSWLGSGKTSEYFIFYNPNALKVSNLNIRNRADYSYAITSYTILGSNNNSNWVTLTSGTNTNTAANGVWDIAIPSGNRDFYKYYKIYCADSAEHPCITTLIITATYITV